MSEKLNDPETEAMHAEIITKVRRASRKFHDELESIGDCQALSIVRIRLENIEDGEKKGYIGGQVISRAGVDPLCALNLIKDATEDLEEEASELFKEALRRMKTPSEKVQ